MLGLQRVGSSKAVRAFNFDSIMVLNGRLYVVNIDVRRNIINYYVLHAFRLNGITDVNIVQLIVEFGLHKAIGYVLRWEGDN